MQASDSNQPVSCVFCGHSVVTTDFVLCGGCSTPAHRDCWKAAAQCGVYACGSTEILEPAIALFRSDAATTTKSPEVVEPSERWQILASLIRALETSVRPHRARLHRLCASSVVAGVVFVTSIHLWWPASAWVIRTIFTLWLVISIVGFFATARDRALIRAVDAKLTRLRTEALVAQALMTTVSVPESLCPVSSLGAVSLSWPCAGARRVGEKTGVGA